MPTTLIITGFLFGWSIFTVFYFRKEIGLRKPESEHTAKSAPLSLADCIGPATEDDTTAGVFPTADVPTPVSEALDVEYAADDLELPDPHTELDLLTIEEAGEREDKEAAIKEEQMLADVEMGLSKPAVSEESERELGEKLRSLKDLEIFHALCADSSLRAKEVLAKTADRQEDGIPDPIPTPEPDVAEENTEETADPTADSTAADPLHDFLNP